MSTSAGRVAAARGFVTPERAACALLVLTPMAVGFGGALTQSVKGLHVSLTDLIVAALAALGVYTLWRARQARRLDARRMLRDARRDRPEAVALLAALLAYVLVIIVSIATAFTSTPVIKETLKWGEVFVAVCAAWGFIRTERQVLWLAWGMIAGGLAQALLGCAQDIFALGLLGPGGASLRVVGSFDQPNPFAGYLNLSLPIALAVALFAHDPRMRWVAGGASAILLFALYLADSRGALLGLAAAVIVIAIVGWRQERRATLAAAIGVPLVAIAWVTHLIPVHIQERLLAQFRVNDISLTAQLNDANFSTIERLAHWVAGLRMFLAHPLLGVGAGNYSAAYQWYKVAGWDESLGHAHNYYINVAAETGVLGLLAFLAVITAALYVAWRATRVTDRQRSGRGALTGVDARALSIGFAAVIVALCVHNFTDNLFVHAMELQFGLTLGLLLRLTTPARPQPLRLGFTPDAASAVTQLPLPDAT